MTKESWIITLNYIAVDLTTKRLFRTWNRNEEHGGELMNLKDSQMVGLSLDAEHEKRGVEIWV